MGKIYLILVLTGLVFTQDSVAQNAEKNTTRLTAEYFKDLNRSESIVATLRIRETRYLPYQDAEINFYSVNDTVLILLSKVRTDVNGEARYIIDDQSLILIDSSGFMNLSVEYEGNASTESSEKKLAIKKSDLKLSFLQVDSTKYVSVLADEIKPDLPTKPIEALDVLFFIKGTFSLLNIGEGETDQEGKAMLEFPVDMPGDSAGVLTIVAKIENDIYGNVETQGVINWGKPVPIPPEKHRGLGDTDAPLWMVYTLIILLSAVWFHYLYVIFAIFKIKSLRSPISS